MTTDRERLLRLFQARHPLIALATGDEDRTLEQVMTAANAARRRVISWSAVRGITEGLFDLEHDPVAGTELAGPALRWCWQQGADRVFVFCDLAPHLDQEVVLRALRELVSRATMLGSSVVLVDRAAQLPECLEHAATRMAPSLPDDAELSQLANEVFMRTKADLGTTTTVGRAAGAELLKLLRGLDRLQARRLLSDLALRGGALDAAHLTQVSVERAALTARHGLLDQVDPAGSPRLAGAAHLVRWLEARRALSAEPTHRDCPRGILLLGVPGAGKSLAAKAVARTWGRPLLRLEVGRLYDAYIGASERRLREALAQADAAAPVVLWIDEIEKAFASAAAQSSDGGLSQRLFGSLLTWMQERSGGVFLVATANDVSALPPELLRRGRFDEIFFVDLPSRSLRGEILALHLERRGHDPAAIDLPACARASRGATGADLEAAVVAAGIAARNAGAALDTAHLLVALGEAPPLAQLMPERIAALRAWARDRCRMADEPETEDEGG